MMKEATCRSIENRVSQWMEPYLDRLIGLVDELPLRPERPLARPLQPEVLDELGEEDLDLELGEPLADAHARPVAEHDVLRRQNFFLISTRLKKTGCVIHRNPFSDLRKFHSSRNLLLPKMGWGCLDPDYRAATSRA